MCRIHRPLSGVCTHTEQLAASLTLLLCYIAVYCCIILLRVLLQTVVPCWQAGACWWPAQHQHQCITAMHDQRLISAKGGQHQHSESHARLTNTALDLWHGKLDLTFGQVLAFYTSLQPVACGPRAEHERSAGCSVRDCVAARAPGPAVRSVHSKC
jgi:hypothetical protein